MSYFSIMQLTNESEKSFAPLSFRCAKSANSSVLFTNTVSFEKSKNAILFSFAISFPMLTE